MVRHYRGGRDGRLRVRRARVRRERRRMHLRAVRRMAAVEHPHTAHQRAVVGGGRVSERGPREDARLDLGVQRRRSARVELDEGVPGVRLEIGVDVEAERMIGEHVVARVVHASQCPRDGEFGLAERRLGRLRSRDDRRPVPAHFRIVEPVDEQLAEIDARRVRRASVLVGAIEPRRQIPAVLVLRARAVPEQDRAVGRNRRRLPVRAGERDQRERRCQDPPHALENTRSADEAAQL